MGHRFVKSVTNTLRHNLQVVLRSYGADLWYSDTDTPNEPIFDTILGRIQRSDFCIFDDRETETRPNVLIELGAAIALGRPYFYFNYENKRPVRIAGKRERITTASDLAGMLYMPYTSYEELLPEFALRLPGFLRDRKLAR